MFKFNRKKDYPQSVLEEANKLMEAGLLVVPNKDCFKVYCKGLVIIEKLNEQCFSIIGESSIESYKRNHTKVGDGLYELLEDISKKKTREESKTFFFENIEKFIEIVNRGMPKDKERMSSQKIALQNMTFEDDKFSVCGWETTLGKKDILIHKDDDEKKLKKPEIDLVVVNPSKREMILVEYKCKGESMIEGEQNIAQHGIDYMQVLYSNNMVKIRNQLLDAFNVCRKMKKMSEISEDTYNEYKVKVGFLFVDKIFNDDNLISEITETDYVQGMKLLNENCQYLGDNIVYIRAETIENIDFERWNILRDSELRLTI